MSPRVKTVPGTLASSPVVTLSRSKLQEAMSPAPTSVASRVLVCARADLPGKSVSISRLAAKTAAAITSNALKWLVFVLSFFQARRRPTSLDDEG